MWLYTIQQVIAIMSEHLKMQTGKKIFILGWSVPLHDEFAAVLFPSFAGNISPHFPKISPFGDLPAAKVTSNQTRRQWQRPLFHYYYNHYSYN